jgi:hypothetical protein
VETELFEKKALSYVTKKKNNGNLSNGNYFSLFTRLPLGSNYNAKD